MSVLPQARADELMQCRKRLVDDDPVDLPLQGRGLERELISTDGRDRFWLNVYRGRIALHKCTYQERHEATVLVRLDVGGRPHTNPDGEAITGPHLHEYREGWETRWAKPAPVTHFAMLTDLEAALRDFLRYCNVENIPPTQRRLFP